MPAPFQAASPPVWSSQKSRTQITLTEVRIALFDGSDPKVRVTVALYPGQVEELKAEAVDSDGKRVSLSRVVRAVIDFGLRDIRRRERRRQMKAEESDISKPHRQGQFDASLVAPVTKQVHDAVLEEAERQAKDRATF